jgi:hypothetical protein
MPGNLIVVGSGIHVGHITLEAQGWIQAADKVLYLVADPVTARWIKKTARAGSEPEDLTSYYPAPPNVATQDTFNAMASRIAFWVNAGLTVCAVFYGHPSQIAHPANMVTSWATRQPNITVRMIPGISAIDCLFADRNINPGDTGVQMFEAYEFLERLADPNGKRPPTLDPYCHVVFWEIGLLEERRQGAQGLPHTLHELRDALSKYYDVAKQVILHYQRPQLPIFGYVAPAQTLYLADLPTLQAIGLMTGASTLYIPPKDFVDTLRHGMFEPVYPSEEPMTPGDPSPLALDMVASYLYNMLDNPVSLSQPGSNYEAVVKKAGLGPAITNTLNGTNVMAILEALKGLVPPQSLKSSAQPYVAPTTPPEQVADAVALRAADQGSVTAMSSW